MTKNIARNSTLQQHQRLAVSDSAVDIHAFHLLQFNRQFSLACTTTSAELAAINGRYLTVFLESETELPWQVKLASQPASEG